MMREHLKVVLGKLEEARNQKDVIRLNCVNEKLTHIKGFIRIAEQADVAMQEAHAKNDETEAIHEFTKVVIAGQRVAQKRAEAEACGGVGDYAAGQSGAPATVVESEPGDLASTTSVTSAAPASTTTVTPPPPATTSAQGE
jgi:hypothetical protein